MMGCSYCYGLLLCFSLILNVNSKRKKEDSLDTRVQRLTELSRVDSIIRLKGDRFRRYVETGPRNYSIIIMMTAEQHKRQCPTCNQAKDEYQIMADSWHSSKERSNQLFFTMADVDEAPDVFQKLKLNKAPVFVYYPAKGKAKKTDMMEINRLGFAAEQIARWIAAKTGILIQVVRPPNYTGRLSFALLVSVVAALLYAMRDSLHFLYDPTGWAVSVLMMIFAMTSGQMWNYILGPPLIYKNPTTGETQYILGDFQGQFLLETYLVLLLQVAVVVGFILLNEACFLKSSRIKKRIMALSGLGCIAVFFTLLLSIFAFKHIGYPYSLLSD